MARTVVLCGGTKHAISSPSCSNLLKKKIEVSISQRGLFVVIMSVKDGNWQGCGDEKFEFLFWRNAISLPIILFYLVTFAVFSLRVK